MLPGKESMYMATCDHPSDLVHRIAYPAFGAQGCELIGGFQHCRRRRKNGLLPLPASKEWKLATYFAKV